MSANNLDFYSTIQKDAMVKLYLENEAKVLLGVQSVEEDTKILRLNKIADLQKKNTVNHSHPQKLLVIEFKVKDNSISSKDKYVNVFNKVHMNFKTTLSSKQIVKQIYDTFLEKVLDSKNWEYDIPELDECHLANKV